MCVVVVYKYGTTKCNITWMSCPHENLLIYEAIQKFPMNTCVTHMHPLYMQRFIASHTQEGNALWQHLTFCV